MEHCHKKKTPLFSAAKITCAALGIILSSAAVQAAETWDFETSDSLDSTLISGHKQNFTPTNEQAHAGSQSLKFVDLTADPYESFTYDIPFDNFTSGIVSLWFYDARGAAGAGHTNVTWGGSVILEDADNPQDFVAVEVASLPYPFGPGGPGYYASEGSADRAVPSDRFDSNSLPSRTVGFHKVEFHIGATESQMYVDGLAPDEVAGPGAQGNNLRLRIMADSPSNGGSQTDNWITAPHEDSYWTDQEWLFFDDLEFSRETPTPAETHAMGFELVGSEPTPEYDAVGVFLGPGNVIPPNDNQYMNDFVNQWEINTSATVVHSGQQAARFANAVPTFRSITFDLATAQPNTSATLWFYDAVGPNDDFDKTGGSIIIEDANNPADFLAVEISNWPYPSGEPVKNYYLTRGIPGSPSFANFYSQALPDRSIGWHKVEIGFYATHSLISVDGTMGTQNGNGLTLGPGLDKTLQLRLMADGASDGGFGNWTASTELTAGYLATKEPYVYYDDISLPISPSSSVNDWQVY